jgi:hypothetical protein
MATSEDPLSVQLVARPPRETSGSRSANRFDFQKDWTVCKLIELHRSQNNYLVLCDFHEDVIVLDHEENPNKAKFFQIKTQTGKNWTIPQLLSRSSKGKGTSILGKLYGNYLAFSEKTESIHMVSNAPYEIKLSKGKPSITLQKLSCGDIDPKEVMKINQSLGKETATACDLPNQTQLFLEVTPLSVMDHSPHTKGKLSEYLDEIFPGKKHAVTPIYRVLFDAVRKKTTDEWKPSNFDELRGRKAIGRTIMSQLLKSVGARVDLDKMWESVRQILINEGVSPVVDIRLENEWKDYEVKRMDYSNDLLQTLREKVIRWSKDIVATNPDVSLRQLYNEIVGKINQSVINTYGPEFLKSMALMETYEHLTLQKASKESEEET